MPGQGQALPPPGGPPLLPTDWAVDKQLPDDLPPDRARSPVGVGGDGQPRLSAQVPMHPRRLALPVIAVAVGGCSCGDRGGKTAAAMATATEEKRSVDGVRDGGDGSGGDGMATACVSGSSAKKSKQKLWEGRTNLASKSAPAPRALVHWEEKGRREGELGAAADFFWMKMTAWEKSPCRWVNGMGGGP